MKKNTANKVVKAAPKFNTQNEGDMKALVKMLSGGNFMTTAQIMMETGCAKPTAYRRMRRLRKLGLDLRTCRVVDGIKGPKAIAYAIVPNDVSKALLKSA